MKTDQSIVPNSEADFWINKANTGLWRTAGKEHACGAKGPRHTIKPGQRYLDTGERDHGSRWVTLKFCEAHANET